jgi:anti-sigma factor RsiW
VIELSVWRLPEQHLLPDAVVAFVDGELSPVAHGRAAAHIARCSACAAEAAAQQQARAAMQAACAPTPRAALLAALQAIPGIASLPSAPDFLAITDDGQFVVAQRAEPAVRLRAGSWAGSSLPFPGRGGKGRAR